MSVRNERHSRTDFALSHADQVLVDVRQDFFPKFVSSCQIHFPPGQVFDVELSAEIGLRSWFHTELHDDVGVVGSFVAGEEP